MSFPDPRFLTYYASDSMGPYAFQRDIARKRVTIPYSGSSLDNKGCCMPGYRKMIPDKGYRLIYNDYPFYSITMNNGEWPVYATQP
jgi:hypothetical protein